MFWDDEEVQDLLDRGHAVGSHSWTHSELPTLTPEDLEDALVRANGTLQRRTGFTPTCLRPPYGLTDQAVERTLERMNLTLVGWDADPAEWSNPPVEEALAHIEKWERDGMVILFHDRKWQTLEILRAVLEEYGQEGWTFAPLPECLRGVRWQPDNRHDRRVTVQSEDSKCSSSTPLAGNRSSGDGPTMPTLRKGAWRSS